jgi:hypothetical protein
MLIDAKIGDFIRSYDFKPMKGRNDCFVEGTVLDITNEAGFLAYKIEVEVDGWDGKRIVTKKKTNRIGEVVFVPFQVSFMEYAGRVINLSR